MRAVLMQEDDEGNILPIYASKTLDPAQRMHRLALQLQPHDLKVEY